MIKRRQILKNKKGFTLVEAIAVVAIMGILATVIGGLVTSGTTAYMRQKENSAAKDLGTIVQNEIKQMIYNATEVYLQGEKTATNAKPDDSLVSSSNSISIEDDAGETTDKNHSMTNAPASDAKFKMFKSKEGKLFFSDNRGEDDHEYFTDISRPAEARAFYGSFTIDVYFMVVVNSADKILAVKVFCDVYNKKGQKKFESPGIAVVFLEEGVEDGPFKGVFSYKTGDSSAIDAGKDNTFSYKNMLRPSNDPSASTKKFTTLYYLT